MAPGSEPAIAGSARPAIDPALFRSVLGRYPTGVCVVTAQAPGRDPVAMVVGTFTSVSLEPPLIGFFPARSSGTWPRLRGLRSYCVNVLSCRQADVARQIAGTGSGAERLAGLRFTPAANGAPVLEGAVATIECERMRVLGAGDHVIALCSVSAVARRSDVEPLIFLDGRFAPCRL